MSPERHEQIKRLFLAACVLEGSEREAFLVRECQDDPSLRDEVESLLRHHHPETIIAKPAGTVPHEVPGSGGQTFVPTSNISFVEPPRPGFDAGTVIAGRYRIVSRLGAGGMGEVYRADDLKLERPVALKFLTLGHTHDAVWLARFYNEARLALAVTHPNVCRIYDIGEAGGEAFLSMEYIDGENLYSLLKRIGRLPLEKSIEIARELCLGMGAAHTQGVLHLDLKPANIMIDGRGQVRITDFGIAVLAAPSGRNRWVGGTPGYIAPEMLAGQRPTVRSDIYALGAVMYELVTGRGAFDTEAFASPGEPTLPPPPSQIVDGLDPAMDRIVLRCLEVRPADRPASAYEVLTLLPGSDPLATLLAAGQTPPPEIVAAASTSRPMRSQAAVVCILATVVALTAVILLADHTLLLSKLGLGKSPHVLVDRAADIVRTLGGEWNGAVRVGTFIVDVREGGPAQVYFEERSQSGPSKPTRLLGDPNPLGAGVTSAVQNVVRLDRAGRLLLYMEDGDIPAQGSAAKEPDWRVPFEMAGLSLEAFSPATPSRTPPGFADHRREWKGRGGAGHQEEVRVAGASLNGRVIYFNVVEDWKGNRAALSTRLQKASSVGTVLFLVTLLGSLPLAWKNVRAGRGDRRGAWRLAMFMLALDLLWWLCRCRHVWQFTAESNLLLEGLRACGFTAVMVWVYYIALEPLVRRFRPRSMVSWSRVLAGRLHDPLVGRDMLVGIAAGVGVVLLQQVVTWAPKWMSGAPVVPLLPDSFDELGVILGFRYAVGTFARTLMVAVAYGMTWAMVLLLLWKALRRRGPTVVAFWVAVTLEHGLTTGSASLARWLVSAAIAATLAALFTLNGLLAASVSMFVMRLLLSSPLTSDPQMWWAGPSALVITVIVLLLGFAYHAALRGQARHYSTA